MENREYIICSLVYILIGYVKPLVALSTGDLERMMRRNSVESTGADHNLVIAVGTGEVRLI